MFMKNSSSLISRLLVGIGACVFVTASVDAQVFTVQVGSTPLPPTPLVSHGDLWHYHKGTNYPGADWKTNPLPVAITRKTVDSTSRLIMVLAPGGGQAIRIRATP